jgi:hypothetical protein
MADSEKAVMWNKAIDSLLGRKRTGSFPTVPTEGQVKNAGRILEFSDGKNWPAYKEYLTASLGEAMEGAFNALRTNDKDGVVMWVARADALYEILTAPQMAQAIINKVNQKVITP